MRFRSDWIYFNGEGYLLGFIVLDVFLLFASAVLMSTQPVFILISFLLLLLLIVAMILLHSVDWPDLGWSL